MNPQPYRNKFLIIDDSHILEREKLRRRVNQAVKHPEPVLRMDAPWDKETDAINDFVVLYDKEEGLFKMWYTIGCYEGDNYWWSQRLAYATSTDGLHWDRPELGLVELDGSKRNNHITPAVNFVPSIIIDASDIPERRYKAIFITTSSEMTWASFHIPMSLAYSADGIHWQCPVHVNPVLRGASDGGFSLFYDVDRRKYLLFTRRVPNLPRDISLYESHDLVNWEDYGRVLVPGDEHDPPEMYNFYHMTPFRYEGMFLSMVAAMYTSPISETYTTYNRHPNHPNTVYGKMEIQLAYSRDGRAWRRPVDRTPVVPCGPRGSPDAGQNLPSMMPIVKDGQTWVYYLGQRARHCHWNWITQRDESMRESGYAMLARMPEDHWVSLDAGSTEGWVLTKPHHLGMEFLVNADAKGGSVEVELLTPYGEPVKGFTRAQCVPVTGNGKDQQVKWKSGLSGWDLNDQYRGGVCAKLYLQNAKLYSYTITEPDPRGKISEYWANVRWSELIKHKSDNWDRPNTEPPECFESS